MTLTRIVRYIRLDKPEAARKVTLAILEGCASLTDSPNRSRRGKEPETRELVLAPLPYLAVYRVKGGTVEILRIWHTAQQRDT